MRNKSKTAMFLGVFFLLIGIIWMTVIFVRGQKYMPKERKQTSYSQIYNKHHERLTVLLSPLPVKKYMPKAYIIHFWTIAYWEFFCALLYLLSGIFLLRAYPIGCHLVFFTLSADVILKALIVTYQHFIMLPLREVFQRSNIMFTYFIPDAGLSSRVSSYLTGIKLVQPGALYYGLIYAVVMMACFFTVFRLKHQFTNR